MKSFYVLSILLIFSTSIFAQAKIDFENTTVSFSNIKQGSNGERSFKFKNTGNEVLIIEKVTITSGNLKLIDTKKKINPGDKGEIKVVYDTKVSGPVRRTITVYSNAKNKPVIALKIKGNILDKES